MVIGIITWCFKTTSNSNYLISKTHTNFFAINNDIFNEQIKIEQVRNLLKFLSKSTFSRDLKIVLIDNFEKFNMNSVNALLKAIEEPSYNTFFFIIHDNSYKISETIKSRCIEFKFFFTLFEKKNILVDVNTGLSPSVFLSATRKTKIN